MKKVPASVSALNKIFPEQWIRESARRFRVVKRETKVDIVVLFWTLVMAPLTVTSLKIADLQRAFEGMAGTTLASSAFQGRLSKELAAFLLASVRHAIEHVSVQLAALPLFSRFKDVLAQDSTLIKLPDVLATLLPGSRTNSSPAALKLNMVYSVVRATPHQIAVAKGREAEVTFLDLRRAAIEGYLLLIDLGYFCFQRFARIDNCGGFFISRLKANANPRIVEDRSATGPGQHRKLTGLRIKDAIKGLWRDEIDVVVEVKLPRKKVQAKKGQKPRTPCKSGQTTARFRVVGVRHPQSGDLHLYVTNVMDLRPEQVRVAYTARWAVELFFDECKNVCRMSAMPSERKEVVEILVYAALLRMLCCRAILDAILKRLDTEAKYRGNSAEREAIADVLEDRLSLRRASKAVIAYGPRILQELLAFLGLQPFCDLDLLILAASLDPNRQRDKLRKRLRAAAPHSPETHTGNISYA